MKVTSNPLANPSNWQIIHDHVADALVWAYMGEEASPWLLVGQYNPDAPEEEK